MVSFDRWRAIGGRQSIIGGTDRLIGAGCLTVAAFGAAFQEHRFLDSSRWSKQRNNGYFLGLIAKARGRYGVDRDAFD